MSQSCSVCCNAFNNTTHKSIPCKCKYSCCKECAVKYTLSSNKDIHCMNCKTEWTREFVLEMFGKTFVNNTYKIHREQILYERELGLLQATLPNVEETIRKEQLKSEIKKLKEEKIKIQHDLDTKRNLLYSKNIVSKNNIIVRKCPGENCKGFLNSDMKCSLCNCICCNKCREIIIDTDHVCDEEIVKNVSFIKKDAKGCPACGTMISKISGCDQMFCVECHVSFSWKTLQIETGVLHNPHYFEYLAKTKTVIERNPEDVMCGRELDNVFVRNLNNSFVAPYNFANRQLHVNKTNIMETCREVIDIQREILPSLLRQNIVDKNLDLRINYMRNLITDKQFKLTLQQREKKELKNKDNSMVVSMYIACMTDILYRILDYNRNTRANTQDHKPFIEEIKTLQEYVNEQLKIIGENYKHIPLNLGF